MAANMEFNKKVVVITGASSGIGAATAIYFARHKANISLVGRRDSNLLKMCLYCQKETGVEPLAITADITDTEDAQRVISSTVQHFSKIDILVNNAGVIAMGGIKNTDMESYDKVMSTNIRAVYHLTMLATPYLIASKGCIVNVSCITSAKPNTNLLAYSLSKAALDHFTKCIALELAADGVRVNSVNPGIVKTNLLKHLGLSSSQLEHYNANLQGSIPLKRTIESNEVAEMILFLCSQKARNITGSIYVIDGGSSLK